MLMQRFTTGLVLFVALLIVGACGGKTAGRDADSAAQPVIQEQSTSLRVPEAPFRVVVPGDTLYSIAWESGRDYRELSIWNNIPPPYTIKPGQEVRVIPPDNEKTVKAAKPPAQPKAATTSTAKSSTPRTAGKSSAPDTKSTAKAKSTGIAKSAKPKSDSVKTTSKPAPMTSSLKGGDWAWPADGKIVNHYSESRSKGLDIGGNRGSPVRAAASGRVVYQGSGLRGYGQLIIIKHNDEFLSAYAHNDRIHVKEGDAVRRGQKIADMGSSGTDQVKLHFEIRRQGQPTDPLKYLPRR